MIPKENINCKTDCIRDENLNRSVAIKKKKKGKSNQRATHSSSSRPRLLIMGNSAQTLRNG